MRVTIKSLQDRITVIEQSREEWRNRAYAAEAKAEKKAYGDELQVSFATANDHAQWRGKYEGFVEAARLFMRTEADAKAEIEERTKYENQRNRY